MADDDPLSVGDEVRIKNWMGDNEDFVVEKFRGCLGIFLSPQHRQAGNFTPLCELYEPGPNSEQKYIGNYGAYHTNEVPSWMQIPKGTIRKGAT